MRVKKETLSYLILGIIITISSLLIGCNKNVLEEEKQVYAWPIATASPEDTVTQIFAEKFGITKFLLYLCKILEKWGKKRPVRK